MYRAHLGAVLLDPVVDDRLHTVAVGTKHLRRARGGGRRGALGGEEAKKVSVWARTAMEKKEVGATTQQKKISHTHSAQTGKPYVAMDRAVYGG